VVRATRPQAVEPRAALPYWDYTIDSVRCAADLGCVQTTSELFTDDFMGASFPKKTADTRFAVKDSVFANAPMPRASGGDAGEGLWPEHNVFGMLTDRYIPIGGRSAPRRASERRGRLRVECRASFWAERTTRHTRRGAEG
jgi:hypothetical protein